MAYFFCSATQLFVFLSSFCVVVLQFSYFFRNNRNARYLKKDVMDQIIVSSTFCIEGSNDEFHL